MPDPSAPRRTHLFGYRPTARTRRRRGTDGARIATPRSRDSARRLRRSRQAFGRLRAEPARTPGRAAETAGRRRIAARQTDRRDRASGQCGDRIPKIKELEARQADIDAELERLRSDRRRPLTLREVQQRLDTLLIDWRSGLRRNIPQARQMLRLLLAGQVVFKEEPRGRQQGFRLTTRGTTGGLITIVLQEEVEEPLHKSWRPHRDSNPSFGLERATS
jgi:hypothetical protein